jgi:hypothetical protein
MLLELRVGPDFLSRQLDVESKFGYNFARWIEGPRILPAKLSPSNGQPGSHCECHQGSSREIQSSVTGAFTQ